MLINIVSTPKVKLAAALQSHQYADKKIPKILFFWLSSIVLARCQQAYVHFNADFGFRLVGRGQQPSVSVGWCHWAAGAMPGVG